MGAAGMPQETEIAALLNLFMYLDYEGEIFGLSFSQALEAASETVSARENEGAQHALEILRKAIGPGGSHPELAEMQVTMPDYKEYDGIRAAVFTNGDDAYVIYRGTGDGKWIDNGEGMTAVMTPSQKQAIDFFDDMAERFGWDEHTNLTVSGHSKGGNNSQAATLGSEHGHLVDQCISFDGQGMSPDGAAYYREELGVSYDVRIGKMYSVNGENDPVNELGENMFREDHVYYIETNAGDGELVPTHALEYLFQRRDENGNLYFSDRINKEAPGGQGPIGRYAGLFYEALRQLPEEQQEDCAMFAMQLIEFGEITPVGYNGHHATIEEMAGLFWHGLPLFFQTLLLTQEGRTALGAVLAQIDWAELEEDLYRALEEKIRESIEQDGVAATLAKIGILIWAAPFLAGIVFNVVRAGVVILAVVEILDRLRILTEKVRAFIDRCLEAVQAYAEDVKSWVKEHVMGQAVVREADFCVSLPAVSQAAGMMGNVRSIYLRAAFELDDIRRELPVQGLGGWALRAMIGRLEIQVHGAAEKTGKLSEALEACGGKYQLCECRIRDSAPAC